MKKNRSPQFIASVMAICVILWMASGLLFSSDKSEVAEEKVEKALFRVRAMRSQAQLITRETKVNARTVADREVTVRAELGGQVVSTGVERGSPIREGQLIASLEKRDRAARLAQASAVIRQRMLELESARKLAGMGLKSQSELASAEAELESAKAEEELAKLDMERTSIVAPFDGMLVDRYVEKGDYLSIGTEVAKVADLDPIVVKGFLTEREIEGTHTGMKASATLSTGETIEGIISYISPEAETQSRMYQVEMDSPNSDGAIRSGITAELIVPHEETYAHFISPAHVLLSDSGVVGLMLAEEDGSTHFSPINIVNSSSSGLWVDGLPRSTIIVTTGKDFIAAGQVVELVFGEDGEQSQDATEADAALPIAE
ncbi:MAG: efflux RND transporter periplasmic adaptor subunit [Opitutales bacterium]|nr:efflux RND transporter periplasmic adaptor subunit [Opitutales bacterium]